MAKKPFYKQKKFWLIVAVALAAILKVAGVPVEIPFVAIVNSIDFNEGDQSADDQFERFDENLGAPDPDDDANAFLPAVDLTPNPSPTRRGEMADLTPDASPTRRAE